MPRKSPRYLSKHDRNRNQIDDRFELLTTVCAIAIPFMTLPQLHIIYIQGKTDGLSATTWFLYAALTIPLFIYSLKKKDLPITLLNGTWIVIDLAVWIGIILQ